MTIGPARTAPDWLTGEELIREYATAPYRYNPVAGTTFMALDL